MSDRRIHVIGAGLAGLSAAVKVVSEGGAVEVSEACAPPGGRGRADFAPQIGLTIDNGNHLVLSGNKAVMSYLARIGAEDRLSGPDKAEFDFVDLRDGQRWTLRPNEGPAPWWVTQRRRRVPGTRTRDYLGLARLIRPKPGLRVDQVTACSGPLWDRLLQPFLLSALNTEPQAASADLAAAIVRETLANGGRAYRPRIAEPTLSAAFVEPALEFLAERGAPVRLGRRLRNFEFGQDSVRALTFSDGDVRVAPQDSVVLAAPPWIAAELIPGISTPNDCRAIINGHFRIDPPTGISPLIGVIGGTAEWIFAFEDRISVTVSAGDRLVDMDRAALADLLWRDIAAVHGFPAELPPWQIVKEKRATFAATPEQNALRPVVRTRWKNLFLAGDWVQTGLPATIEGSLRSGEHAADLALQHRVV